MPSTTEELTRCKSRGYVCAECCSLPGAHRRLQVGVYFDEIDGTDPKYVPRSVQVDLEAGVCNQASLRCVPYALLLIPPSRSGVVVLAPSSVQTPS